MSTKMKQLRWCLRYQGLTKSQTWTFFNKFCQLEAKNELLLWGLLSLKGLLSKWNIVVLLRTFLALSLNFTQNAAITWRWKLTFLHCGDGWRNRCSTRHRSFMLSFFYSLWQEISWPFYQSQAIVLTKIVFFKCAVFTFHVISLIARSMNNYSIWAGE